MAGVVVREDGRVLVIRRADNGAWEPPGGVLELAEAPEDGARREVYEETGIEVRVDRLTGVYKNTSRGMVALVFRCRTEGGYEQLSAESTAVEWLTPDEVAGRMTEVYAVRVADALLGGTPQVRTHDGTTFAQPPGRVAKRRWLCRGLPRTRPSPVVPGGSASSRIARRVCAKNHGPRRAFSPRPMA